MGNFIKFMPWERLAAYAPPIDVGANEPMAALLPREGETPDALRIRFTETLIALNHTLNAQRDDKTRDDADYDSRHCRRLVQTGLMDALQDKTLAAALAPYFPQVAKQLLEAGADIMAAATLAALATMANDELRLPEPPIYRQLLKAVEAARPQNRDGYNGETGRSWHNGGEIDSYYESFFPLALLLITEPELAPPETELYRQLQPYIRSVSLDEWATAAEPHFKTDKPRNYDPRPVLTAIVSGKLEDTVLMEEHVQDWGGMIDETLAKVPAVSDKAAELYADLVSAAYRNRQWFTLADELPTAIRMNGDRLRADFILNAALMLHGEGYHTDPEPSLKEADKVETLRHTATTARRYIKLAEANRYRLYDRACNRARHAMRL